MKNEPQNRQETEENCEHGWTEDNCSMCDDIIDGSLHSEAYPKLTKEQRSVYAIVERDSFTKNSDNKDIHPNSLEALKPYQFVKGQSGNIKGRPPKHNSLSKKLSKIGNEVDDDVFNDNNLSNEDRVIEQIWKLAKLGDKDMIKLLVNIGGLE